MTQYFSFPFWRAMLLSPMLVYVLAISADPGVAQQVIPDGMLGAESSQVNAIDGFHDRIDGGAIRGSNLFHSFQRFNIQPGHSVDFSNPVNITNIFSRVTGDLPSSIDGRLGVDGLANLFLINPNGILFGASASLNLKGSFLASTASSVLFPNGERFSATTPKPVPMLTVDSVAPIGLQFEGIPSSIEVQRSRLSVFSSQTLALVGGEIKVNGGYLQAESGQISLGALGGTGTVNLTNDFQFDFSDITPRANISLANENFLNTGGSLGGSVQVYGKDVTIAGVSKIVSNTTGGALGQSGGNIIINAAGTLTLKGAKITETNPANGNPVYDSSAIGTAPLNNSFANGGDIVLHAKELLIQDGAFITSVSIPGSKGKSGNIILRVEDLTEVSAPNNGLESGLYSGSLGAGNGGKTDIETGRLIVKNGAQIAADNSGRDGGTAGTGAGGDIRIVAKESVELDGVSDKIRYLYGVVNKYIPLPSGIPTFTASNQSAGNIDIQTPRLKISGGGYISAGSDTRGNAGKINITGIDGRAADSIQIVGSSGDNPSGTISQLPEFGNGSRIRSVTSSDGKAGEITIKSHELVIQGAARIDTRTTGKGNAGNIKVDVETLNIFDGGQIISTTTDQGAAGRITVNATKEISIAGIDRFFEQRKQNLDGDEFRLNDGSSSGLLTRAKPRSSGRGGDIILTTPNLNFSDEAVLNAQTNASGDGGGIQVHARDVNIQSGSQIVSNTFGSGNAGKITIDGDLSQNATGINIPVIKADSVQINGSSSVSQKSSGIFTNTDSSGRGGNIAIDAENFAISDRAVLNSRTQKDGVGGQITINATRFTANAGGQLVTTTSGNKQAGSISVNVTKDLSLNGSASPLSNNQDNVVVDNQIPSGFFANTSLNSQGNGGGIFINQGISPVEHLAVTAKAQISVNSQGSGTGGSIQANARRMDLDQGRITAETQSTDGGGITLDVEKLLLMRHQSQISTNAGTGLSGGDGGNILINANAKNGFVVASPSENNDISANAFSGGGGQVQVNARAIFGIVPRSRADLETLLGTSDPKSLNPRYLATSEITAISQQNPTLNGKVIANSSINPDQGLNQALKEPRTTNITDNCQVSNGKESVQFYDIGHGGLPPRPEDPLSMDLIEWSPRHEKPSTSTSTPPDSASEIARVDNPSAAQSSTTASKLLPPCQSH